MSDEAIRSIRFRFRYNRDPVSRDGFLSATGMPGADISRLQKGRFGCKRGCISDVTVELVCSQMSDEAIRSIRFRFRYKIAT